MIQFKSYAAFEEELKDSIERGNLADFIIIDKDYMACPKNGYKDIIVLEASVGQEVVFRK